MYIQKVSNEPSSLDSYIEKIWQFIGMVITLGNSIILVLSAFFERKGVRPINNGMLGSYIKQFEVMKVDTKLVHALKEYNKYLILAKHSVLVGNEELTKTNNKQIMLQDITTKKMHIFDESDQHRIMELASSIMKGIKKYG